MVILLVTQICSDLNSSAAGQFLVNCIVSQAFGLDWTMFAFVLLGLVALAAYMFRLPTLLSLGFGFCLVFSLSLISGGSEIFNILLLLLGFGVMLNIVFGILRGVGEHS